MPPRKKTSDSKKKVKKVKVDVEIDPLDVSLSSADDLDTPINTKALVKSGEETESITALQKYLADIGKYALLTREEEHALAVKYKETGDREAAEKLVTSNLRFVVKIAAEYSRFGARMIDLIQEGNLGLMHGVREFNPYKGVKLITYAVWWIRGYIQDFLMRNYSQVRLGTTQNQKKLFYHLSREKAKLDAAGTTGDTKLLSEKLGVSIEELREMQQRMSGRDLSLDAPQGDDDSGRRWVESQADVANVGADDTLANEEEHEIFKREIKKIIPELNEKEKYLLEFRILGDPPMTLQEVGDHFKITRERARQLEERVIGKIKVHFSQVLPDYKIEVPTD